jgi:uncharacterized protein involved in outer membrane biogenesis
MRRYRWAIIAFIVLAAVLMAAGYAAAPTAKRMMIAKVESATGLTPSVGSVSLSLWRGVATAHNVVLPNVKPYREPTLLRARRVSVSMALLPLLSKRVEVSRVAVKDAEVTLERDRQGRTNLQALQERVAARARPKEAPTEPAEPTPLRVDRVTFTDSAVRFVDHTGPSAPTTLVLKDIRASVRDIDSTRAGEVLPSPFNLQATVDTPRQGRIRAEGRTNPFGPLANFDLKLTMEQLDLPVLQELHPERALVVKEGLADLTSSATCRDYQLNAHNQLALHNLDVKPRKRTSQVAGLPATQVVAFLQREKDIELEFDVTGDVRNPKANLQPVVEELMAKAIRDQVLSAAQALIEARVKAPGAGAKTLEGGKKVDETGVEGTKKLGSGLKKLFGQ